MDEYGVKTRVDGVHKNYLCSTFRLQREIPPGIELGDSRPDLYSIETPTSIFELKSRTYPINQTSKRKRPISDFGWWALSQKQINDYEKISRKNSVKLFWILVLGKTDVPVSDLSEISEAAYKEREIWVVPWETYQLVECTPARHRHLGLNRLRENYDFSQHTGKKHTMNIESSIDTEVRKILL